jgi:hypothetical protein
MKPMLASDWDKSKVMFPVYVQPKIDGVRGLNMTGDLLARSLKKHKNRHVTALFSHPDLVGLDGEFAAQRETHPDLCRLTSSAMSTITGQPFVLWWLFDYVTLATKDLTYAQRYEQLVLRVAYLQQQNPRWASHLRVIPNARCDDMQALLEWDKMHLDAGFEGTIIRDPYGKHKQGRSTVNERGLLRIKTFVDAEAVVIRFEEGQENGNVAQTNELGKTFRTTHAENMIPNGQVGTIVARIVDTDQVINVSPGNMTAEERKYWWSHRVEGPGKVFTFKHFPKGVKDLPRFPTWKCWRDAVDMSA